MSDSQAFALLADPNKVDVSTPSSNDVPQIEHNKSSSEEGKETSKSNTETEKRDTILNLLEDTQSFPTKPSNQNQMDTKGSEKPNTIDLSDVEIKEDPTTPPEPELTPEQIREKKEKILYDIERLRRRGVRFPRSFTMASDLVDMESEYNRIKKDLETEAAIRFQRKMLMTCVSGIEMLNGKFDPFDVHLDGWSESVNENIGDYDDVFEELYDKYKGSGKMAPELRLLFMLGGSALMFHMTKSMFSSAAPQVSDILRANPNLAAQMQHAAMQQMGGGSGGGGLAGMMNMAQSGINSSSAAPPPPRGVAVPPPENVDDVLRDLQGPPKRPKQSRKGKSRSSIDTLSLSLQS